MNIFDKKVSPIDCTLAIALPLTKQEFFADLHPDAAKDYAKFYRSQIWGKPDRDELWEKYHTNFVVLIEDVASEVEHLGVKVVRDLKLTDLPATLSGPDVVSLVSHWRAAEVEHDDFLNFSDFVNRLRHSSLDVISRIRQGLSIKVAQQVQQSGTTTEYSADFQKELIGDLNALLENDNLGQRPGFEDSATEQRLPVEHRTYLNRIELERAFEGLLKKGNQMEFFDGLQSVHAIRDQVPDEFCGFLDLIVCNSVLPAEPIKSMKRNCLIIGNQYPARPSFRLLVYKAIIQTLHNRPDTFVNAMTEVREGLDNYLQTHE
jgi:hypothetical protein